MVPSCERLRVSYTMSDSMSCIRRAKENGSEPSPDKPAAVGPVFPSATRGVDDHEIVYEPNGNVSPGWGKGQWW